MVSLVIGGARSGKSRYAQSLAANAEHPVYLATARPEDAEMSARIAQHRRDRSDQWITVEEPLDIAGAIERHAARSDFLLVDCLTIWLSNFCWEHRVRAAADIEQAALQQTCRAMAASSAARVVFVTNEVGCGIVPESSIGRLFRDLHGRVNQNAAALADEVILVVAGIPVVIKQPEESR